MELLYLESIILVMIKVLYKRHQDLGLAVKFLCLLVKTLSFLLFFLLFLTLTLMKIFGQTSKTFLEFFTQIQNYLLSLLFHISYINI